MATVDKRILIRMGKELTDLEQTPPLGVACYPVNDNIVHLQAEIAGPEDSPYHGGSFKIDIHIPDRYPFEPPRCQFLTRVYHPNIDEQGLICLDILKGPPKGTWLPSINITTMLISLQLLLAQPNPDDPLLMDVVSCFLCLSAHCTTSEIILSAFINPCSIPSACRRLNSKRTESCSSTRPRSSPKSTRLECRTQRRPLQDQTERHG
ncbi:MAG: ubiquitin-conjugating enzyme/RWD-like protein [Linnemannia elongata]|nr:MAG: ubiquitin-conjugating enzyme/RWD-like protein [Linnemannia elongata]